MLGQYFIIIIYYIFSYNVKTIAKFREELQNEQVALYYLNKPKLIYGSAILFFHCHSLLSSSICPPHPASPGSLDAEQTLCSVCKITRLIKANKQTTALRQQQMRANLYTINKRRSSFNHPLHPAHCSPPPLFFFICLSSSNHPPTPPALPFACSLSQSSPCCWAGLKGKEN